MKYKLSPLLPPTLKLLWASLLLQLQLSAQPNWSINPAPYQYSMTLVAQIQVDGQPEHALNNHLALIAPGGQLRGYAAPVAFGGQAYYFLNVYSNVYKNDTLYFRAYRGADQNVYESVLDTLAFKHHLALGSIGEPLQIRLQLGDRPLLYSLSEVDYEAGGCAEILDVQATDNQNSEGAGLTYAITGGADAARFGIQPQTGVLSWFNFLPDPETPADANSDNRYEVEVRVTDTSGLFDFQKIVVRVVPAAPPAPLVCPDNVFLNSSDDGTGDCGATSGQTAVSLPNACALSNLSYQLSGATNGSGDGQVPANQVFAAGLTTLTYTLTGAGGSQCAFEVYVQDDEPPTVVCPASLTVSPDNFNPCSATVEAIDAVYGDNCAVPFFTHQFDGATQGGGDGQASGAVLLLGTTTVTYSVIDGSDHYASCQFTVTVTACNLTFSGAILWSNDQATGVKDATVNLTGAGTGSALSDVDGNYLISISPTTGNFSVKPVKNQNKVNGLTMADATAVQQHITGSNPFTDPYKLVAADVNNSNSITSLDATIINQAVLGNPSALAQIKNSWRFVPASYALPNPPWGFPEQIDLTGVSSSQSGLDFYGIKTGDVVAPNTDPANFGGGSGKSLVLRVADRYLQAGESFSLVFTSDGFDDLAALQVAFRFDPARLQLDAAEPVAGGALPLGLEHFGLWQAAAGDIRVAWSEAAGKNIPAGAPLFALRFTALASGGLLSDWLQADAEVLPGLAYTSALQETGVGLQFSLAAGTGGISPENDFLLFQNRPNPFSGRTVVGFVLPEACVAALRVFDASGRLLLERSAAYPAGYQEEMLELGVGVFYYALCTPFGVFTRRMVGEH